MEDNKDMYDLADFVARWGDKYDDLLKKFIPWQIFNFVRSLPAYDYRDIMIIDYQIIMFDDPPEPEDAEVLESYVGNPAQPVYRIVEKQKGL